MTTTENLSKTFSPRLVQLLVLIISFVTPFAANMFLPSLPSIAKHFASSDELMELTITSFLLGFGLSQLIYGPCSDRFGRRKTLLFGFSIALIGGLICAFATNAWELIISRFVLGSGVAAGSALTRSILRDCFSGRELSRIIAQNSIIFSLAPVAAPLFGSYIDKWFGWETNFLVIATLIAITWIIIIKFLQETNNELDPTALHPKEIIKNYWHVFSNRIFLVNVLCAGFSMSALNTYNTLSPFLFQQDLNVSVVEYGWITALIISGILIGRVGNSILLSRMTPIKVMKFGNILMIISAIALWVPALFKITHLSVIVVPILIFIAGTSFIAPNAFSQSLEPFSKNVGVAGALYGAVMLLVSFVVSAIVAVIQFHNQMLLGLTYVCLATGVACAMLLLPKEEKTNNAVAENVSTI